MLAVRREEIATPAASSDALLIRLPYDSRAIEISMSRLTPEAAAAALKAALLVAMASAIYSTSVSVKHPHPFLQANRSRYDNRSYRLTFCS